MADPNPKVRKPNDVPSILTAGFARNGKLSVKISPDAGFLLGAVSALMFVTLIGVAGVFLTLAWMAG